MTTKHDLCAEKVKLDFAELLTTAGTAYAATRRHVEISLCELQHLLRIEDYRGAGFPLIAQRFAEDAARMAVAAATYYALLNAQDRETVEIINKPKGA